MSHEFSLRRRIRNESGQTVVLVAVTLPVLVGFLGLVFDVGYALDYKKQMQMASDSAALAGALAVYANSSITSTALTNVVNVDASQNGFLPANVTITACRPGVDAGCTSTYSYATTDSAVKVTMTQTKPTFFAQVLNWNSWSITTSAVASKGPGGTTSMLLLGTTSGACTNTNGLLTQSGGSILTFTGDVIVDSCSNSALAVGGGSTLSASTVSVDASSPVCSACTPAPVTSPYVADPLAGLVGPTAASPCTYTTLQKYTSGTHTITPGTYCAGIDIEGNGTDVTMTGGAPYIITSGGFNVKSGASAHGTDIFIYMTGTNNQMQIQQTTSLNGGVTFGITAMTTGTYKGIAIFQDPADTATFNMAGSAVIDISGVIYMPTAPVNFSGGSASGSLATYTVWVVASATFSGGSYASSNNFGALGGNPLGHISIAE